MEFLFLGFGAIGLPFIFIYLDLRYGYKNVFNILLGWIPKIIRYFKQRKIKIYNDNFSLTMWTDGKPYILDFVKNIINKLNPRPDREGFTKWENVIEYVAKFETEREEDGISFLGRCIDVFANDKEIGNLIIKLKEIITDEQYGKTTPYINFKKDLIAVLVPLEKLLENRLDYIKRNKDLL